VLRAVGPALPPFATAPTLSIPREAYLRK